MWFEDSDWARICEDYTAFWKGELERPLIAAFGAKDSSIGHGAFYHSYEPEDDPSAIVDKAQEVIENTLYFGDAFPCFWPNFGPGITTAMAGICELHYSADSIWFEPKEQSPLENLHIRADYDNKWFIKVREVLSIAAERFNSKAQVGFPDLGGNLDLLSACRTPNNLLMDLMDYPEQVKRVTWEFHEAWWDYYKEFVKVIEGHQPGFCPWSLTWAPKTTYILQCDFASMISPDMFEEFALPEIKKSCEKLDYPFFHLDGPGMIAHLDILLTIEQLRGIQWVPGAGEPTGDTWTELVTRILDAGKMVQLITNRKQTLNAVKNFGVKNLMYIVTEPFDPETAESFLKDINSFL